MKTILNIRLKAFKRSLTVLALDDNLPVWKDQHPEMFTTKHDEAVVMVAALEEGSRKQEAGLGGVTEQKDREEAELEDAAFALAQALVLWFADEKQESHAGEVDLTKSDWVTLSNQRLLTKSKTVIDLATGVTAGADAARAAKYGITPAAVQTLVKEHADYDHIVNAPGVAQSVRRALTKGFRPAFNLVEAKFKQLDALIIQFGRTEAGRFMIAEWREARIQKGAGTSGAEGNDADDDGTASPGNLPAPDK